jgi:hypothetical protein
MSWEPGALIGSAIAWRINMWSPSPSGKQRGEGQEALAPANNLRAYSGEVPSSSCFR